MLREFFGTSIEEALDKAEKALGIGKKELKYKALEQQFGHFLKPLKRAVLVDVDPELIPDEVEAGSGTLTAEETAAKETGNDTWAKAFCEGVIGRMGIAAEVEVSKEGDNTIIQIEFLEQGPDLRKGVSREFRGALQHLLNRVVAKGPESGQRYFLDIGGTLKERTAKLRSMADFLAEKAIKLEEDINIHLMDSQDRRLLHVGVMDKKGIETQGHGDKQYRVLSIGKKRNKKRKRKRDERTRPKKD